MTIWEALNKMHYADTLSSPSASMMQQSQLSLLHWVLGDPEGDTRFMQKEYEKIIAATDWEIDQ